MYKSFISLLFLGWLGIASATAQQVMLQGFYWDYPKTGQGYNWSDTLRLKATALGQAGFSHVWYPPFAGNGNKSGGYDPKDLFIGTSQTSLGTLNEITSMVNSFTASGITPVADMVYNHRDGGKPENNPAVKEYMLNYAGNNNGSCQYGDNGGSSTTTYKQPFPSDRVRMVVPIGGSTGLGVGHYYININSHSGGYVGQNYLLYITTNGKGGGSAWDFANGCSPKSSATTISSPNGTYSASLKQGYWVEMNNNKTEFDLNLQSTDFNAAGDSLFIQAVNLCGNYTDHRIWKIWYGPGGYDIADQGNQNGSNYKLLFQTYTDFSGLSSGRGALNWNAFRPNWNAQNVSNIGSYNNSSKGGFGFGGASGTCLGPNWSQQSLDYFNDYDHSQSSARDTLIAWTKWAYDKLGSKGLRMDAVKHFDPQFVADMLSNMYNSNRSPNFVVGEWYGENLNELKGWVDNVTYDLNQINPSAASAIPIKVFDFSLRRALKDAIDNGANARQVYFTGLRDGKGMSGFNIVTFLNNHDFRSSTQANGDALVYSNPILGYAYLLTNNQLGVPTVFYPDYYGYPARNTTFGTDTYSFDYHPTGLSPMKTDIDRLMKILKTYINGSTSVSYLNHYGGTGNAPTSPTNFNSGDYNRCLIYQLNGTGAAGGKDVIVAINFGSSAIQVDHAIAIQNGISTGTRFLDVLGKSAFPYAQVDGQNRIYIDLPAKSYSVWVRDVAPLSATLASAPSNGTICPGQSATLTANVTGGTAPYTYSFSSGVTATGSNSVVTANTSNTYSVTVTDALGLTTVSSFTVTVSAISTPTLTSNAPICAGQTLSLTASSGLNSYTFASTGLTATGNSNTTTLAGLTSGSYSFTVTGTNADGCTIASNALSVTVNANPTPSVAGNLTICAGSSTTLTASGGSSYLWDTGDLTATAVVSPTATTTYAVTVSAGTGCWATTTVTVEVNPLPTPAVSGNLTICNGNSTTLTASGGNTYNWDTGDVTAAISVTPTTATTYNLTVTSASGCSATTAVTVDVSSTPNASISGNLTICAGSSATLTASGGDTYNWDTGDATATVIVGPTITSTYAVTISSGTGCSATTAVTVDVNPQPTASVTDNLTICAGSSTTLTASGGSSYLWNTNTTAVSLVVSPTSPTTYTVTVTTASGCSATTAVTVSVVNSPTVTVSPTSSTVAAGQSVSLQASGALSFIWSTGEITAQISATSSEAIARVYSVTGTSNGCSGTASAAVSFTAPCSSFTALQVAQSGWMCNGIGSVNITATAPGATSYTLLGPSGSQSMPNGFATTTRAGTYTVLASNGTCVVPKIITVANTSQTPSVANLIADGILSNSKCSVRLIGVATGTAFVIQGPNGYVFSNVYRTPGTYNIFANSAMKPGTYWLTVYLGGCQIQQSVIVTGTSCN